MDLPPLIAISPGDADPLAFVLAIRAAGVPGVLLREPTASRSALEAAIEAAGGMFVAVHVRSPHATALNAPIHSFAMSCHAESEVTSALATGHPYVSLSPVFQTVSKPDDDREPIGEAEFVRIASGRPVYALGGITADRLRRLRDRGVIGGMVFGLRAIQVHRG